MPRKYSYIYSHLVKDENDLIGHIAYSLYKTEKIDYIKSKEEQGVELSDNDLEVFNGIISRHIKSIYESKELDEISTVAKNATIQIEGGGGEKYQILRMSQVTKKLYNYLKISHLSIDKRF